MPHVVTNCHKKMAVECARLYFALLGLSTSAKYLDPPIAIGCRHRFVTIAINRKTIERTVGHGY